MLDLSSFTSIDRFVAEIKIRCLKIDILINNAGLGMIPFAKTEQDVNVMGTA